jgi:hypothetical protein
MGGQFSLKLGGQFDRFFGSNLKLVGKYKNTEICDSKKIKIARLIH